MKYTDVDHYLYKRIALIGAIANPNTGDDAILDVNLHNIENMYGEHYKVYVFTKDASYTVRFTDGLKGEVLPVDYLHRITLSSEYNCEKILKEEEELLSERTFDDNVSYAALRSIFEEIDVLHIIGGGYLNSMWPDMLIEVHIAAKLAKKYGKKVLITGISTEPMSPVYMPYLLEILEIADVIDYRDDSYIATGIEEGKKLIRTLDDAVVYDFRRVSVYDTSCRYAVLIMNSWQENAEEIREKIQNVLQNFMIKCLQEDLDYFYVLGFAEGDLDCWDVLSLPEDLQNKIKYISLVNKPPFYAKDLIKNALFSIGTRYHQAVFALSSCVPVFSLISDDYYRNKICLAHAPYGSDCYCELKEFDEKRLLDFYNKRADIRKSLQKAEKKITDLYNVKRWLIATAYGIDDAERQILFGRLEGKERIKVSVIVPVYNMESYLQKCLDSVLSQTMKEIEVICINDGSTDRSQEILYENAWRDHRIHIICQNNMGVAAARNAGLKAAVGEFVYFLDPDDWLYDENALHTLYKAAVENKVYIAGGGFAECNESAREPVTVWNGNLCRYTIHRDGIYSYKDFQYDYGWIRFLYNREFLVKNEFWFPHRVFYEDPVWFVHVMHTAQIFYACSKMIYCYRTGYKSYDLPEEKVIDLLKGMGDIIVFAQKNQYFELLDLEKSRLTKDYSYQISRFLKHNVSLEIRNELERLNGLLYPEENGKIEYDLFNWQVCQKDMMLSDADRRISDADRKISDVSKQVLDANHQIEEIHQSITWKIGNILLFIPKMIARALRHEVKK